MPKEKLFAQARDELFSHINRCGVLNATDEDKTVWMDETIDYIGERYPELAKPDLSELHSVGIRFCQPAINNVGTQTAVAEPPAADDEADGTPESGPVSDDEGSDEPTASSEPALDAPESASGEPTASPDPVLVVPENTSEEGDDANAA